MALYREPDGSVVIDETPIALRAAMIVGAVAVPWGVVASEGGTVRTGLGFVTSAFMLFAAYIVEARWFRFDSNRRLLHWRRTRLFGGRRGTLSFDQVTGVVARPTLDPDSSQKRPSYQPVLLTTEGELPLSNSTSLDHTDFDDLLVEVRGALGLTAEDAGYSVEELVRAGRTLDAIALVRRQRGISIEDAHAHVHRLQEERTLE